MPLPHHDEVKATLTKPPHYWGSLNDWIDAGYGPTFGKHRDSDQLGLSNYHTVEAHFRENFEYGLDFVTDSANHSAVGWVENIVVRVLDCECGDDVVQERHIEYLRNTRDYICEACNTVCTESKIFVEALEFLARVQDYPVLDEEDFSRREYEDMMEYLTNEVGEEHADALWRYLYDTYSANRPEDVKYEWIEEWKKENYDTDD